MAIMVNYPLGCDTYQKLCKILKQGGNGILPPWIHIRQEQSKISPEPALLSEPYDNIYFSYEESMKLITQKIIESLPPSIILLNPAVLNSSILMAVEAMQSINR